MRSLIPLVSKENRVERVSLLLQLSATLLIVGKLRQTGKESFAVLRWLQPEVVVLFCNTCSPQLLHIPCYLVFSSMLWELGNMIYIFTAVRKLANVGRFCRIYLPIIEKVWDSNCRFCMYTCPVSVTSCYLFSFFLPWQFHIHTNFSHFSTTFSAISSPLLSYTPSLPNSSFLLLKTFSVYVINWSSLGLLMWTWAGSSGVWEIYLEENKTPLPEIINSQ